ncbi:YkyA family protein [Paenibacillus barcinonensis]|uniref:Putative cell-wall binding lipoprotein n=1 Tax=Paenibacillus barcinonensis TaxID=198119 RepID=A0A2V4VA37_PAEBA|nr:YkyA family protein [Paenibacillus barcinonensis]PYE49785.1 putative cell-wall binding lipoprotein [Paenibacillus barcinonensis]QKS56529.1 YkyA family protein [Paenibacillus barcinonensis]
MQITRRKIILAACSLLLMLLLSGCGEPQEPAANQVNRLVQGGQQIDQSLKAMTKYEEEDMELYKSILSKGKSKNSNIEPLLDQAEVHIKERRDLLQQTGKVMQETAEKTEALRHSLKELTIEKPETLLHAGKVLDQYEARAKTFELFVASYESSLSAEEELYGLMRASAKPNLVKIKRAIRTRNEAYAKLGEVRKQFNLQTQAFNAAHAQLVKLDQAG